jgi:sugar/nucleoside kinase (ribokinase family)
MLEAGAFDVCFCNEDEAAELAPGAASPEAALGYLAQHCRQLAVVTLGEKVGRHNRSAGDTLSLAAHLNRRSW